jgi:copper chaperone CopZ
MRRDARTFRVSGMHCAGCVGKVEAAPGGISGVMRVTASLEPGLARVELDGDRVNPEAIARAIDSQARRRRRDGR